MTLDQFMAAKQLTDEVVASALGVSRPHVTRLRHGDRGPSLKLALSIERWSAGAVTAAELLTEQVAT